MIIFCSKVNVDFLLLVLGLPLLLGSEGGAGNAGLGGFFGFWLFGLLLDDFF